MVTASFDLQLLRINQPVSSSFIPARQGTGAYILALLSLGGWTTWSPSQWRTSFFLFSFFSFLGLHLRHMEVPRLGGLIRAGAASRRHSHSHSGSEPELRLRPTWQGQILNLLSEARIEPTSSWILVRFITCQTQWELLKDFSFFLSFFFNSMNFINLI